MATARDFIVAKYSVPESPYEETFHFSQYLIQQIVNSAMRSGIFGHAFRFRRGDDRMPRRIWSGGVRAFADAEGIEPARRQHGFDPHGRFELTTQAPDEPTPAEEEPSFDWLRVHPPKLTFEALSPPTPLSPEVPYDPGSRPVGAVLWNGIVEVSLPIFFETRRLADLGGLEVHCIATIKVRPHLTESGGVGFEHHASHVGPILSVAGRQVSDQERDQIGARLTSEIHACVLALIGRWKLPALLPGRAITAACLWSGEAPSVSLATGSRDATRLEACLDPHEEVLATLRTNPEEDIQTGLRDRLRAHAQPWVDGIVVLRDRRAWSTVSLTLKTSERADDLVRMTTRVEPVPGHDALILNDFYLLAQCRVFYTGERVPVTITGTARTGDEVTHYAFNNAFFLSKQRAVDLVLRREMALMPMQQLVRSKSGPYFRDKPDQNPRDNITALPVFNIPSTRLANGELFLETVRYGRFLLEHGYTTSIDGQYGLTCDVRVYPPPPTAAVILVHGVAVNHDDIGHQAFVDRLVSAHYQREMRDVVFLRMYWGYDEVLQGTGTVGSRYSEWAGLSDRAWAGSSKLKEIVSHLRSCGGSIPITVISHSNGCMVTLAALQEGLEIDNWVLMGAPLNQLDTRTGNNNNQFALAAANVRGEVLNCWSQDDWVAVMKGGIGERGLPHRDDNGIAESNGAIPLDSNLLPYVEPYLEPLTEPLRPDAPPRRRLATHPNLDIANYPAPGARPNVTDVNIAGWQDHSDWWKGFWVHTAVQWPAGIGPTKIAEMVLGKNLPPRAPLPFELQGAMKQELDKLVPWANSYESGSWWIDDDDLAWYVFESRMHLVPHLTTTFFGSYLKNLRVSLNIPNPILVAGKVITNPSRVRFRVGRFDGADVQWTDWHEATHAHRPVFEQSAIMRMYVVEIENATETPALFGLKIWGDADDRPLYA